MNGSRDRWLATGLITLAVGLAINSVLGPLITGVVDYPFSETLVNQTIGLEAVTLLVVVPWSVVAAVLVFRGHRAGPIAAVPPTAYTAYMFVQYIVGPQYLAYRPVILLHLTVFILGWLLLAITWTRIQIGDLPSMSPRRERIAAMGLFLLAAFTVSRYLPAVQGILTGAPLSEEFVDDPSMYWSIVLLDLGIVVPVTVTAAVGLLRSAPWARKAVFGIAGWFTLVPISVSAMGIAMVLNDDPNAAIGTVVVLSIAALLFTGFAAWVYRPLLSSSQGY